MIILGSDWHLCVQSIWVVAAGRGWGGSSLRKTDAPHELAESRVVAKRIELLIDIEVRDVTDALLDGALKVGERALLVC